MIKMYVSHDDYTQNIDKDIEAYQKQHPEITPEEYHRQLRALYEALDYQLDFFKDDFYFYDPKAGTHIGNYGIDLTEDIQKVFNDLILAMEAKHSEENPGKGLLIHRKEEFLEQIQRYATDPDQAIYGESEPIVVNQGEEMLRIILYLYDEAYVPQLQLKYNPKCLQKIKKTYDKIYK